MSASNYLAFWFVIDFLPWTVYCIHSFRYYHGCFAPGMCAKYCHERVCVSVCRSICSPTLKTTVQISPNFLHMLPVTVARSSSGGNAIRYVLPFAFLQLDQLFFENSKYTAVSNVLISLQVMMMMMMMTGDIRLRIHQPLRPQTWEQLIAHLVGDNDTAAVIQSFGHGLVECNGVQYDGVVQVGRVFVAVCEVHHLHIQTHTTSFTRRQQHTLCARRG